MNLPGSLARRFRWMAGIRRSKPFGSHDPVYWTCYWDLYGRREVSFIHDCMAYEFDVFLSYRRHGEWPAWVNDVFRPLLYHWLGEELGSEPHIFVDRDIETGDSWPARLGHAIGHSRALVPLFSRQYFSSPWCQRELGLMFARESRCNLRTSEWPHGLIVPAHIHDGQDFPQRVKGIQGAQLQPYTNVRLARGSQTEELLSDEIRKWVPDIANTVRRAPEYDPSWATLAVQSFMDEFASPIPVQRVPPSLG